MPEIMKNSFNIISDIIQANEDIQDVCFLKYPDQEILQKRVILDCKEEECIENALKIREQTSLPFWDSLMLSFMQEDYFSNKLLLEASHHNSHQDVVSLSVVKKEDIEKYFEKNKFGNLAILSKVKLKNGNIRHLPLLDFHISNRSKNLKLIEKVVENLGQRDGYILKTNKSFHYYGTHLMTQEQMLDFLNKSLFFTPILDKSWIAHQLLEECCALRIGFKNKEQPVLLKEIGVPGTCDKIERS